MKTLMHRVMRRARIVGLSELKISRIKKMKDIDALFYIERIEDNNASKKIYKEKINFLVENYTYLTEQEKTADVNIEYNKRMVTKLPKPTDIPGV